MTQTVNVLHHLQELRESWRRQNFRYTKDQQARRERVKYFYDEGLVAKPGERLKKEEEEEQDD